MKRSALVALTSAACVIVASKRARGELVGLDVVLVADNQQAGGGVRDVYHVYATFTDSSDRVNAWGGGGELGIGVIENVLAAGGPGTGFINLGGAGAVSAPYAPGASNDWDTFPTIGLRYWALEQNGDGTTLFPGTPTFIAGNSWTAPAAGGGVFMAPGDEAQGRADYIVGGIPVSISEPDDTALRTLIMQLTVPDGEHVHGTIASIGVSMACPARAALSPD
jgi:hypothetical protein